MVIDPAGGSVARSAETALTETEALAATVKALSEVLATPITAENQESRKAEIDELEKRITSIRREIQVEKEKMAEEAGRLAQEARRVEEQTTQLNTQMAHFTATHQGRHASRIPPGMAGQVLFPSSPQAATPPGFTPPREPVDFIRHLATITTPWQTSWPRRSI